MLSSRVATRVTHLAAAHPYGAIFLFALMLRVVLALVIVVLLPQLSFFDDGTYSQLATERINGESDRWDSYASWLYLHTGTLLFPLTLLYQIFGVNEFAGPLLVAVFGAATAAVTARLAAEVVGVRGGVVVGLLIAVMPSQVLISSVLAKDALTWFLLASLALVVARAAATDRGSRLTWLVCLGAGLLVLLGLLRLHTMTVAAFALLLAAWFGSRRLRPHRLIALGGIAIMVPWVLGIGPLGLSLVANQGSLEGTRAYHARGGSAVPGLALPAPTATATPVPSARPSGVAEPNDEVNGPISVAPQADGAAEVTRNLSYLPRGISVILLEPVPWRQDGSTALRLAATESIVWYPVLLLAGVGAATSWRRRETLAFPVLTAGALVCMWALVDGNVGTAFRHRGEVVWAAAVLAAYGLSQIASWRREGRFQDGRLRAQDEPPMSVPDSVRVTEGVRSSALTRRSSGETA